MMLLLLTLIVYFSIITCQNKNKLQHVKKLQKQKTLVIKLVKRNNNLESMTKTLGEDDNLNLRLGPENKRMRG